jgi:hypothetical protein
MTKFTYPEAVFTNGTLDSEATLTAVELAIDAYNEGIQQNAATIRKHAEAVFSEAGVDQMRKPAVVHAILNRMGATPDNCTQLSTEINAGLAMCLIGSVNGSSLASADEVAAYRASRAARKASK